MGYAPATATSAAAVLSTKKSKHPRSYRGDEQPLKRHRAGVDGGAPKVQQLEGAMCDDGPKSRREESRSSLEKDGINKMLLALVPTGSDPRKVLPLPDSILRVLQENQTGGGDGELEIDVHALCDDALRKIKNRVGAYLADTKKAASSLRKRAAPSKKEAVPQTASTRIPLKAPSSPSKKETAPTRVLPKAPPLLPAPTKTPSCGNSTREILFPAREDALGDHALRVIKNRVGAFLADTKKAAPSLSKKAAPSKKEAAPKTAPTRIPLKAPTSPSKKETAPTRIPLKAPSSPRKKETAPTRIPLKAPSSPSKKETAPTRISPKAAPSLPAPPKTSSCDISLWDAGN